MCPVPLSCLVVSPCLLWQACGVLFPPLSLSQQAGVCSLPPMEFSWGRLASGLHVSRSSAPAVLLLNWSFFPTNEKAEEGAEWEAVLNGSTLCVCAAWEREGGGGNLPQLQLFFCKWWHCCLCVMWQRWLVEEQGEQHLLLLSSLKPHRVSSPLMGFIPYFWTVGRELYLLPWRTSPTEDACCWSVTLVLLIHYLLNPISVHIIFECISGVMTSLAAFLFLVSE